MVEIHLDVNDDLLKALEKVKRVSENKIRVHVPQDSVFSNLLTLKLLKKEAESSGKKIDLYSDSKSINNLISSLKDKDKKAVPPPEGFVRGKDIAATASKISVRQVFKSKVFITSFVGLLVLLFAAAGLGFIFITVPTATVNLAVKREVLVKTLEVTASPEASEINKEERIVPMSVAEVVEEGSQTLKVTGRETVGDKATGEVVIYNKTDDEKTLKEGTKINYGRTEGEDLLFFLESSVTVPERVASVSAAEVGQSTVTYTFGKNAVGVTAERIGDDYNLESGKTFTVDEFSTSSYIAQNDNDFSGGFSKEIETVTENDHESLVATLSASLKDRASKNLKKETSSTNLKLEDKAIKVDEISREFSKQVGEEAEEVTLTMQVKAVGYLYSQSDLNALLASVLKEFVPEQFNLSEQEQKISIEDVKIENEQLTFLAKVKGSVIPKINTERLKEDIAGKKVSVVESYLSSLSNIASYEIRIFPGLPGPFRVLPRKKGKITINITHEE